MSGLAATAQARPLRAAEAAEASRSTTLALRVAAFAGLCAFAAVQWGRLVSPPPTGRVLAVAAIATAGGAALALIGQLERRRIVLQTAAALATLLAALLAVGLPATYLLPSHWGDLGDGLDRGLIGTSTITWPYAAGDPWIRLSILLGLPVVATAASVAAFAPRGRRSGAVGQGAGLVLLLGLYAFAATEVSAGSHGLRGIVLLLLIGAWLWLPNVRPRDAAAAAGAVVAAGLLALPLSHGLNTSEPWIHWQQWSWFSSAAGEGFQWDHQYGPLTWPRTGKTLLDVKSPRAHYWKAETLDRFDGIRWLHTDAFVNTDLAESLPAHLNPRWVESITIADRDLQSGVLIGAGTVFDYNGSHAVATAGDGTTRILDGSIAKGETYNVKAYVPDPTAGQMRAASLDTSTTVQPYLEFDLPPRVLHGSSPETVQLPAWNAPGSSLGAADTQRVLGSPYRRVYELAHSLAAGESTAYDVVRNTQNYLENHYSYSEQPPIRKYPLAAFLFKDKIGYCQQFAGSMALMLRMDGIPARVAGGFAPGLYDGTTKEYRVRDLDAHSWVEVWFRGIGWVPFDPTPSVAPASAQAAGPTLPSAANGDSQDKGSTPLKSNTGGPPLTQPAAQPSSSGGSGRLWIVLGIVGAILALGALAVWLFAAIRARRLRGRHEEHVLAELTAALAALGHPVRPGDTLTRLERSVSDERVRRYIRLLREARFSPGGPAGPARGDRRALRSGLTAGRGALARLRGYLALPPSRRRFRAS